MVRLVWHRRDLRLHDNPLYSPDDGGTSPPIMSLYVFDPAEFRPKPSIVNPEAWDAVRVGPHASRLLLDSVQVLRYNLRSLWGELIVRTGDPTVVVPQIARAIGATEVRWSEEPGHEEIEQSRKVREALAAAGVRARTEISCTLWHPDDLPVGAEVWDGLVGPNQTRTKSRPGSADGGLGAEARGEGAICTTDGDGCGGNAMGRFVDISPQRLRGMPRIMGNFCNAARSYVPDPRPTLPPPRRIVVPHTRVDPGLIPTLEELTRPLLVPGQLKPIMGQSEEVICTVVWSALHRRDLALSGSSLSGSDDFTGIFRGGETAALSRLQHFVLGGIASTADRSAADTAVDGSSKLSQYLAFGNLSPRKVYESVKKSWKEKGGDEEGSRWIISHLEMRDFFLYNALLLGGELFQKEGAPVRRGNGGAAIAWEDPAVKGGCARSHWECWSNGTTGFPLLDAGISELTKTGYCSSRVRQNLASFLAKDLLVDWRAGAEWFQFLLEDHNVGANWGNWAYFSGVGADPKDRHFRVVSQALRYDPEGAYVCRWIPELQDSKVPEAIFRPWDFPATAAATSGQAVPIVDPFTQLTWSDKEKLEKEGKLLELNNAFVDDGR